MSDAVIDLEGATEQLIDSEVHDMYVSVIQTCNKLLRQADLLGFENMSEPDPNIHEMSRSLDTVVIPVIEKLVQSGDFSPESGMKVANIRQYILHIRRMTEALDSQNKLEFDKIVAILDSEAMLV